MIVKDMYLGFVMKILLQHLCIFSSYGKILDPIRFLNTHLLIQGRTKSMAVGQLVLGLLHPGRGCGKVAQPGKGKLGHAFPLGLARGSIFLFEELGYWFKKFSLPINLCNMFWTF
jgi:hypothetical protein